jgi:dienelactone hydrolase
MHLICPVLVVLAMLAGPARAQEQQTSAPPAKSAPVVLPHIDIPSLDGSTAVMAHLFRPRDAGDAPRPAVVMMHGCSGLLSKNGRFRPIYRAWARELLKQGYVVLVVDSTTSRGFGETCSASKERRIMWRDRPKDAYAALKYLQAQSYVQPDRVALMGWSQGGGVVLLSINDRSIGRPVGLAHDFAAAVAFYPGACAEKWQTAPFTQVPAQGWTSRIPLLVLFGEADVWTQLKPCAAFIAAAQARGNPIELKTYPDAVHAFDAPKLPRTELPQYREPDGRIPVIGTNEAARTDAFARVQTYLAAKLSN